MILTFFISHAPRRRKALAEAPVYRKIHRYKARRAADGVGDAGKDIIGGAGEAGKDIIDGAENAADDVIDGLDGDKEHDDEKTTTKKKDR